MNTWEESNPHVDELVERLICRSLDGELTGQEQAELDGLLAGDPAARALFDDYRRNDRAAASALAWEFSGARTAVARRPQRGLWLATAGAVLAAAAVVALSFMPSIWPSGARQIAQRPEPRNPTGGPVINAPTFVDYRDSDHVPRQRYHDLNRDIIGIPTKDGNTIYILERNVQATRVAPLSGDL